MIIDRYIIKEILSSLLAVMVVLLLIYVSNRLLRFLGDAALDVLSGQIMLHLLVLKTISSLVLLVPLAVFLAILLAFSRLYKDSEMVVLAACGVSMRRIYATVLAFSLVVAVIVAAISLYVAPWAEEQSYRLQDSAQAASPLKGVAAGRFMEFGSVNGVLYAADLHRDQSSLRNVFIQGRQGDIPTILSASRAYQYSDEKTGEQFMVLVDGYRYEGIPGSARFKIIKFEKNAIRLNNQDRVPARRKLRARPTSVLLGMHDREGMGELQWRVSMPLSVILLGLLAVPLSRTTPRQGKYARLFVAIVLYAVYNNLMGVAHKWTVSGAVPVVVGMWWVHAALLLGLTFLLVRQYGTGGEIRVMAGKSAPP